MSQIRKNLDPHDVNSPFLKSIFLFPQIPQYDFWVNLTGIPNTWWSYHSNGNPTPIFPWDYIQNTERSQENKKYLKLSFDKCFFSIRRVLGEY